MLTEAIRLANYLFVFRYHNGLGEIKNKICYYEIPYAEIFRHHRSNKTLSLIFLYNKPVVKSGLFLTHALSNSSQLV